MLLLNGLIPPSIKEVEIYLKKWENVINLFTGNYDNCPPYSASKPWLHRNDLSIIASLTGLVYNLSSIIKNFERYHTTNYNKNLHSIKARLLLKNNYQGYWTIARILASILQYNNPDLWIFKLFKYFHLAALSATITMKLYQIFKQSAAKRSLDHSSEFQEKERKMKAEYKKQLSEENSSNNILAHQYRKREDELN